MTRDDMLRLVTARGAAGGRTLLTVADASDIAGVPEATVYSWLHRQIIGRFASPSGNGVLVDLAQIAALRNRPPGRPSGCADLGNA